MSEYDVQHPIIYIILKFYDALRASKTEMYVIVRLSDNYGKCK